MPHIPDTALGAIIAALIGGMASLLALIISKDQKISDFRQVWIDNLRNSFADYLAQLNKLYDFRSNMLSDSDENKKTMIENLQTLNEFNFRIKLYVNKNEDLSRTLFFAMKNIEDLFSTSETINIAVFKTAQVSVIECATDILKNEWDRVKNGEVFYNLVKRSLVYILKIGLALFIIIIFIEILSPYMIDAPGSYGKIQSYPEIGRRR